MVVKIINVTRNVSTKFFSAFLVCCLFVSVSGASAAPIDAEISGIDKTIDEKRDAAQSALVKADELKLQLEAMITEYHKAYADLQSLEVDVATKERELKSVIEQEAHYQKLLDQLSVFTYRNQDTYMLNVFLGTKTFKDFVVRFDYLVKFNERQADILGSTKKLRRGVTKRRDELGVEKNRRLQIVEELGVKQDEINELLQEQQRSIDTLGEDVQNLEKEKTLQEARKVALETAPGGQPFDARINIVFPVGQGFGGTYINDWGFARAGNAAGHQGTDIFGIKGTPLAAVADGVISEEFGNSHKGGFRLHIVDDQGIDYYYAHLNNDTNGTDDQLGSDLTAFAPGIAPGVRVKQGQVVGYMGDSGDAEPTPPHLHFGISVGDSYVNPFPYLKLTGR